MYKNFVEVGFCDGKILEKQFNSLEEAHKVKECWLKAIIKNKNDNVKYIHVTYKEEKTKENRLAGEIVKAIFNVNKI